MLGEMEGAARPMTAERFPTEESNFICWTHGLSMQMGLRCENLGLADLCNDGTSPTAQFEAVRGFFPVAPSIF